MEILLIILVVGVGYIFLMNKNGSTNDMNKRNPTNYRKTDAESEATIKANGYEKIEISPGNYRYEKIDKASDSKENATSIKYYSGYESKLGTKRNLGFLLWKKENKIYLSPQKFSPKDIPEIEIAIENIVYFKVEGEVRNETIIEGGGGGGSSMKGAVVGGLLAGGAGAIIGSRKKNEPIKTKTKQVDDRRTILLVKEGDKTNHLKLSYIAYKTLVNLIPEKEQDYIVTTNNTDYEEEKIYKNIRKLANLKSDGIITEEEFQEKKKALLEKI